MIFQDASASLAPVRTVGEQVYEAVAAHERTTEREVRKRAFDLFRTLNFETPERLWESYPLAFRRYVSACRHRYGDASAPAGSPR